MYTCISFCWYPFYCAFLISLFPSSFHISICPFFTLKSIILPHSSSRNGQIKTLHLNLWVALKYKATNYIYTESVSLFFLLLVLLLSLSPFLSPSLVFPPFFLPYALFFTVTCVSTCLPLISAFTLKKLSHILKFEESSFQTSRCRQLPHAEHYSYPYEKPFIPEAGVSLVGDIKRLRVVLTGPVISQIEKEVRDTDSWIRKQEELRHVRNNRPSRLSLEGLSHVHLWENGVISSEI